jgi:hypothetical protein
LNRYYLLFLLHLLHMLFLLFLFNGFHHRRVADRRVADRRVADSLRGITDKLHRDLCCLRTVHHGR